MITTLFVGLKICFQEIRKEKKLQHQEKDNQFDDDNSPQSFTHGHAFKALVVKLVYVPE